MTARRVVTTSREVKRWAQWFYGAAFASTAIGWVAGWGLGLFTFGAACWVQSVMEDKDERLVVWELLAAIGALQAAGWVATLGAVGVFMMARAAVARTEKEGACEPVESRN